MDQNKRTARSRYTIGFGSVVIAAAAMLGGVGCQNDHGTQAGRSSARPTVQNRENADELLREAEQAESRGDNSRALEVYNQLRSFPPASRPRDLDARIRRVEAKTGTTTTGTSTGGQR